MSPHSAFVTGLGLPASANCLLNATPARSACVRLRPVPAGSFADRSLLPVVPAHMSYVSAPAVRRVATPRASASALPYTAIITGASSSIGLQAAKNLIDRGDYHVVMAVRNPQKAAAEAERLRFPPGTYTILPLDLTSLASVREFVKQFKMKGFRSLNALVCNAAIWYPKDKQSRPTADGFDETAQVNHLSHFLLANLLLPDLKFSKGRVVFLATQTHNPDTLPGKIPPQADLGDLEGLASGFKGGNGTIDGKAFEPTKAYKDSKVCNILTMIEMDRRFSNDGVTVSAIFPGCIASSNLFREKRAWFRWFFPLFQKYVTRQFVSDEEAGRRVACVASLGEFSDSGKYWQWRGSYLEGADKTAPVSIMPTERESEKAERLWELSAELVGLRSPALSW